MKKNPLKPEYARFGSFDQLRENNREQIRLLFEELGKQKAEPGSIAQKIGDLYNMGLDSVRLNEEGASPIAEELSRIQSLSGKEAISAMIGEMHRTTSAPFFAIYVDADAKNSTMNIAGWYQAGMNMGDRDYYIADDEANSKIRDSYRNYIQKIFTLSGYSAESAAQAAATVLKVETEIAKAAFTREELRDPQAGYNVMTIDELKRQFGGLDWDIYFNTVGLDSLKMLISTSIRKLYRGKSKSNLVGNVLSMFLTVSCRRPWAKCMSLNISLLRQKSVWYNLLRICRPHWDNI